MDPDRFRAYQQPGSPANDNLSSLPPAPEHNYQPKAKLKKSKWWVWLIVILIVLGALSAWAYSSYKGIKVKPSHHVAKLQPLSASSSTPAPAATPSTPAFPTSSYSSTNYKASFSYPSSWTVVDSGSAPLNIISPTMNIVGANGQTVSGQIEFTVAKQGSIPPAFTSTSVAVLTSQKIAFNKPAPTQAADTYISFVQYPSTTVRGGLDGIYVTGNYGYQKYQNIPSSNIATIDPFVDITFFSCANSSCPVASRQPLTIASSDWSDTSFSTPILYILKSFSFD